MKNVQCFFILTAEAAGDKDTLTVAQTRLQRLRQEYSRFSKAAGLRTENERTQVAGFGRKEAARASAAARKEVEKYSAIRYHEDADVTDAAKPRILRRMLGIEKASFLRRSWPDLVLGTVHFIFVFLHCFHLFLWV